MQLQQSHFSATLDTQEILFHNSVLWITQRLGFQQKDVSELSVWVMEDRSLWNSALMLTGNERMKRKELFEMIREIIGNSTMEIQYLSKGYGNHYRYTPYTFQGTSAKKITANPHFDMGQGILECVQKVMEAQETKRHNE